MATLQKIRNRAGLLIIAIGVALLAFIIGDGLRSGSTLLHQSKQVALTIDGKKIDIDNYQQHLNQMIEGFEARGKKLSDAERMEVNNQLAQEYIQNTAIEKIAGEVGIKVTGKEYVALITGSGIQQNFAARQMFTQFGINPDDPTAITTFLSQIEENEIKLLPEDQQATVYAIRTQWENQAARIINERIMQKYAAIMSRSYAINKIDAEFLSGVPSRTVAVVRTPSVSLQDTSVVATDAEVTSYYQKHPELFRLQNPYTEVDFIALQVRPSKQDYEKASADLAQARNDLASAEDVEPVIRNLSDGFAPAFYLTEEELTMLNLPPTTTEFIKTAAVGEVNSPSIENDRYNLVKLLDKKVGPTALTAQIILLDSISAGKADSIAAAINAGTSFEEMVSLYSIDPQTKEHKGFFTFQNPTTGAIDSAMTERIATTSGLDTLFKVAPRKAFVMGKKPLQFIVRVANQMEAGPKYKVAFASVPVTFSEETFREAHTKMNNILAGEKKTFDQMAKEAEEKGIEVVRNARVMASSPMLGNIPSSREVVSWALRGEKGEINKKLLRCSEDYLVIASIGNTIKSKEMPIEDVKEQIRNILTAEKRGDKLAANLAAKNITSMSGYASAMQSVVDTLTDVSMVIRGNMPSQFNGMAMVTALNHLSKPFRAESEVMVVEPLSENKEQLNPANQASSMEQQRRSIGQSLGYRSFGRVISDMKIEDNRGNFY